MQVFIVRATCGEYDMTRSWLVCAYLDEAKAKRRAKQATERAKEIVTQWVSQHPGESIWDLADELSEGKIRNQYDKDMTMDTGGVSYHVIDCELVDEDMEHIQVSTG